jgi:hypothetical protein
LAFFGVVTIELQGGGHAYMWGIYLV